MRRSLYWMLSCVVCAGSPTWLGACSNHPSNAGKSSDAGASPSGSGGVDAGETSDASASDSGAGLADAAAPSTMDLGCASNFRADVTGATVTADWTTRVGCSDNYTQVETGSVHVVVEQAANLWALSDLSKPTGVSGSLFNLGSGTLDNYGIVTTAPGNTFPFLGTGAQTGPIVLPSGLGSLVINNHGKMGVRDKARTGPAMVIPSIGFLAGNSVTLNNYGAIWATNATQGFLNGLSCPAGRQCAGGALVTINNFAGGRIGVTTGSALNQGNGNNYRNAGMFVTDNWSWCSHGNANVFFKNWGYCIAAENAVELNAMGSPAIELYGGPLVPATKDFNGNLMFGGAVSANLRYSSLANEALCSGFPSSAPILIDVDPNKASSAAAISLTNTVYSYLDPEDGSTAAVSYFPLVYGYPMVGPQGHITFAFDGLYASEATQIEHDVEQANAASFQVYTPPSGSTAGSFAASAPGTSKGATTIGGYTYRWCNTAPVSAQLTHVLSGTRPPPGVYFKSAGNGQRQYFIDSSRANANSYFLINPSTVRLTGAVAQPSGTLTISPGWTLAIGARLVTTSAIPASTPLSALPNRTVGTGNKNFIGTAQVNQPAAFTYGSTNSIELQSAMGTTSGNVDGKTGPVTEKLTASLVLDNSPDLDASGHVIASNDVSLPNVTGDGDLVQSGTSTTTLLGTANAISGSVLVYDGTLAVGWGARFSMPPKLVFGSNDGFAHHPVLDLRALPQMDVTVSGLTMTGPQLDVASTNSSSGLLYPTIQLGSTTLVLKAPAGALNQYEGVLTGSGGLDLASGSLALGFPASQDLAKNVPFDISTFSGGVKVEAAGTLIVNSRSALGAGPLENGGRVQLGNATQYLTPPGTAGDGTLMVGPQVVDTKNPLLNTFVNHTVFVRSSYQQLATGQLLLRVREGDLQAADIGSGAGVQYETLVSVGTATLDGTLILQLVSGYEIPAGGVNLLVVQAGAPIEGRFATIETTSDGKTMTMRPDSTQSVVRVGSSTYALQVTIR